MLAVSGSSENNWSYCFNVNYGEATSVGANSRQRLNITIRVLDFLWLILTCMKAQTGSHIHSANDGTSRKEVEP